jgi:hypothetical protein
MCCQLLGSLEEASYRLTTTQDLRFTFQDSLSKLKKAGEEFVRSPVLYESST